MKKRLFVGIDFSKQTFDAVILRVSVGDECTPVVLGGRVFPNDLRGCLDFIAWLNDTADLGGAFSEVLVGGEDTGNYSVLLPKILYSSGIDISLQNALAIKNSEGAIIRDKTDKADAVKIAYYFYRFQDKVVLYKPQPKHLENLDRLYAMRRSKVERKKQLLNQIAEHENLLKNEPKDKTLLWILRSYKSELALIEKIIREVEGKIKEIIQADEDLKAMDSALQSITGIGKVISVLLISITGGFTRFDNAKQLACFCGVSPHPNQSGTSIQKGAHRSRYADSSLAALLHMAALSSITHNPKFKAYRRRMEEKGKPTLLILNNVKNKLLTIAFAIATKRTKYDPTYETTPNAA